MGQTLYHNGTILTMEDQKPCVGAVLTENGRILGTGDYETLKDMAQPGVQTADLQGNVMLPGFIDPHSHFTACASQTMEVDLSHAGDFGEIIQCIQVFIKEQKIPEGQWIQTRSPQGGFIEKEDGIPTGYMEERAFLEYQDKVPMPSPEAFLKAYGRAQELYASNGITTVQEGMLPAKLLPLYRMLEGSGLLKLDLVAYADIRESDAVAEAMKDYVKCYKNHIKLGGYKMFLDGSPQGRTAWMREPYEQVEGWDQPADYKGYGTLSDEEVLAGILKAETDKMQLLAHCNGDMACQQYLNQLEAAYRSLEEQKGNACYPGDIRPVMIHAQLLCQDQLPRVKELKVIPSFFLAHVYHWGDVHVRNFGIRRASHISPAGSALKEGIIFTLHQDSPVISPDMLETLWCAVNRETKGGMVLGREECLPVWEALKALTINGAYQYFEEDEKGSIVNGKVADFAILDRNPMSVEPEAIRDIRVLATIKEDRLIWKRQQGGVCGMTG